MVHYLRKMSPYHSLKTRLSLAIGGSALILSIMLSLIVGNISRAQIEADIGSALVELAYQMNHQLDRSLFERYQDLQLLSTFSIIRDPAAAVPAKRSRLERFQQNDPIYAWLGLADPTGIIVAGTGELREGWNVSSEPWFVQAMDKPYISNVHEVWAETPPGSDQEILSLIDVAVPVVDSDHRFQGVLIAHLHWEWAYEIQDLLLEPLRDRYEAEMFVLSAEGAFLLNSSSPPVEPFSLADLQLPQGGLNGYYIVTWPDGQRYLTAFVHSRDFPDYPDLKWTVLIRQELAEAFAPARNLQRSILAWGTGLGLLFAGLGWVIAERIARPILTMTEAADQIRQGEYGVKIPVFRQPDEIGLLSAMLSSMVETLNMQRQELLDLTGQLRLDIAERERAEAALRDGEERLRRVLQHMPVMLDAMDAEGNIQVWNQECERITGYSAQEMVGSPQAFEILYPDPVYREKMFETWRTAGDDYRGWEWELTCKDGTIKTISWSNISRKVPIPGWSSWGIGVDVTALVQAEADIRTLNADLEKRVRDRTAELEAANRQLESFSYSVSHDLRAPLRAIFGFSQIVRERHSANLPPEAQRYLDLVRQGADQMNQLLDALLAFSRLGRKPLQKERVQPAELVHQVLKELPADLRREQLQITLGDLPSCQADPQLLKQVFANLLSNALKYSSRREVIHIEIGSRKIDGEWVYFIKDNGVGFDMRDASEIFGVFRRLHLAEEYEGTGIGLAIVQQIIQRHGGRVWAEAVIDEGATFYFTL